MNLVYCLTFVSALFFSSIYGVLYECVNIKKCTILTNYISNANTPFSNQTLEVLRKLRCGHVLGKVMVYCPKKNSTIDLKTHTNINLLPKEQCGISMPSRTYEIIMYNADRTDLFEFPWMVLLAYQIGRRISFGCGGTLISERYVLTAAHCITDLKEGRLLRVRIGEYDRHTVKDCDYDEVCADPVQDVQIEETIPHQKYDRVSKEFDIGLLRLGKTINISKASVRPICLPIEPELRHINSSIGVVTGWGRTEMGYHSDVLLRADLPIVPPDMCRFIYEKYNYTIKENRYCAGPGYGRADSCGGDSGGPMQVSKLVYGDFRYVQYGIVSMGPTMCGGYGVPGVYTNVASNLEWILDNIRM